MATRKVQINLGAVGYGSVLVDGTDISSTLGGLQFESHAGVDLNRLTLDLIAPEVEIDAVVQIVVPDATRDALVALGWTPPAADDSRGGF